MKNLFSNLSRFSNEFHITWWWAHSRMCSDKIEFGSSGVIRRHKQIRLVFIGRISGRRLSGGRQSLEIKLVGVAFAVNFAHNVLIVIITAIHYKRKIAHYIYRDFRNSTINKRTCIFCQLVELFHHCAAVPSHPAEKEWNDSFTPPPSCPLRESPLFLIGLFAIDGIMKRVGFVKRKSTWFDSTRLPFEPKRSFLAMTI